MGVEWLGIFSEGLRKILFEAMPRWLSDRFAYRLQISVQLRNQLPAPPHNKLKDPIVSLFVTIRNSGTKAEYIHRCGYDGSYHDSATSNIAEWKEPIRLQERTLVECELRVGHNHDPIIKSVWVENALQRKWHLPKRQLKKVNAELSSVWQRNQATMQKMSQTMSLSEQSV